MRKEFKRPLAVGFGISQAKHVKAIAPYADIAIVGSAMIDVVRNAKKSERRARVQAFARKPANAS